MIKYRQQLAIIGKENPRDHYKSIQAIIMKDEAHINNLYAIRIEDPHTSCDITAGYF